MMPIIAAILLSVIIHRRFVIGSRLLVMMLSAVDILDSLVLRGIYNVRIIFHIPSSHDSCPSVLQVRLVINAWQLKVLFVIANVIGVVTFGFISNSVLIVLCVFILGVSVTTRIR